MPGSVKISGAQRTVAAPYVKVNGTWRTASIAYTKVAGTWRQWYAASITDDFNRADASSLGTVSNGVTSWTNTRGTWAIVSNAAVGSGTTPLASVTNPLQSSNYELKLDLPSGSGSGLAFWVTDADNWYGVVSGATSTTTYSCPNGGTLSGTTCSGASTYAASSSTVTVSDPMYYSCPSGGSLSGTTCYTTSTYGAQLNCSGPYSYNPGGSSFQYVGPANYTETYVHGAPGCTNCSYSCDASRCYIQSWSCPSGQTKINYDCYATVTTPAGCNSGSQGTPCGSGCYNYSYSCPSGGTLSGSTCTVNGSYSAQANYPTHQETTYSCNSGDSLNGTTCTHPFSYEATGTTVYDYFYKVVRMAAGTLSTLAQHTTPSRVASLKVSTSNSSITAVAYTGAAQTGTVITNSYTATSPALTAVAGIVAVGAGYQSSNTVDNFNLK